MGERAGEEHFMWALLLEERGGPEQLRYARAPAPFVGIGDVLVRVHAASSRRRS